MKYCLLIYILAIFSSYAFADEEVGKMGIITGGEQYTIPNWFKESFMDIAEDVDEAQEKNKHVMLFFHLDACPYCAQTLSDFNADPIKSYIQKHFDVIAINIRGDKEVAFDKNTLLTEKELSEQLKVRSTPAVIYLNSDNKPVVRTDGYRPKSDLEIVLRYISEKKYQTVALTDYMDKSRKGGKYLSINKFFIKETKDLSKIKSPMAVIFDGRFCDPCDEFYNHTLADKEVLREAKKLTWVRLNIDSNQPIVDMNGQTTTARAWAKKLKLVYRPGVVLFSEGKEIMRIDSFLHMFHFKETLRYVGGKFYQNFETFRDYARKRRADLLNQGINIDLSR